MGKQNLGIRLMQEGGGWSDILRQLGVGSPAPVELNKLEPEDAALVIINRSINTDESKALQTYVACGGNILWARTGPSWRLDEIFNEMTTFPTPMFARYFEKEYPKYKWRRRRFFAPNSVEPTELVNGYNRGAIRRYVEQTLSKVFEKISLPFLRLDPYPKGVDQVFGFRIDSDFGDEGSILAIRKLAEKYGVPTTWFLHVQAHERWLDVFKDFRDDEIAVHCYRHRSFYSGNKNRENMLKAKLALQEAGFDPEGFAAPYGYFSKSMGQAVHDAGFKYSSEFGFDFDNLPDRPKHGGVLQIPVHPICPGSFKREKATDAIKHAYFEAIAAEKSARREPFFLYHHPLQNQGNLDVIERVFQTINNSKATKMTMGQFADWWKERENIRFTPVLDGDRIDMQLETPADTTFEPQFRIQRPDAISRTSGGLINTQELRFEPLGEEVLKRDQRWHDGQKLDIRMIKTNLLDLRWRLQASL